LSLRTRPAAVAGFFYPSDKQVLLDEIQRCFSDKNIGPGVDLPNSPKYIENEQAKPSAECFIVPHAGYTYSGPVAAHSFYKALELSISKSKAVTAIILGPNHYGLGSGVALSPSAAWETPLGYVKVNREMSQEISDSSQIIDTDEIAHLREHSIEVQIPFLQFLCKSKDLQIIPICLMMQDRETADEVSEAIYQAVHLRLDGKENSFLILGSSDLTHYERASNARHQDGKLLEQVQAMNISSFYTALERLNITACGYGAIAIAMSVAKKLRRAKGDLLKYATSGDVTGDESSVVGYSAVHFS
jgi:AmmeMemoRadiSam system protein B